MRSFLVSPLYLVVFCFLLAKCYVDGQDDLSQVSHNMDEDGYMFEYSVVGSDASWMQSHGEWSNGISTHGSYNVKLPDGRIQKVIYTADEHGFRPIISYENPKESLNGYGLKNHLTKDKIQVDDEDRKGKSRATYHGTRYDWKGILHNLGDDYHAKEFQDPYSPPGYEIAKYDYAPTREINPSYHKPDESKSNETPEDMEDKDPLDKSSHRSLSPSHLSSHKKVIHPVYHQVENYQQGLIEYPKSNHKSAGLYGKYRIGKAKTYYMNKETDHSSSSREEEEEEEEEKTGVAKSFGKLRYVMAKEEKDKTVANSLDKASSQEKKIDQEFFTPKPHSLYHDRQDTPEETSTRNENSDEESDEKESSEEDENKKELNGQEEESEEDKESEEEDNEEESEEDENEKEKSHYMAMMTTMMPPDKPFVPPTYFPPSLSSEESSRKSAATETPSQHSISTTPSTVSEDSPDSSAEKAYPPPGLGYTESLRVGAQPQNPKHTLSKTSPSRYPPYHPPYSYHSPYDYHLSPYRVSHPSHYKPAYPSPYHVSPVHGGYSYPYPLTFSLPTYAHPQEDVQDRR